MGSAFHAHRATSRQQLAAAFLAGAMLVTLLLLLAPHETCSGPGAV